MATQPNSPDAAFPFGANWKAFLSVLDQDRVEAAIASLAEFLGTKDLRGKRFLDIGSGSGLFSLAARALGAEVVSFDCDELSVECTEALRNTYFPSDSSWKIARGSILDDSFVQSLGAYDIVYSWGVLHHTGQLWDALEKAAELVATSGVLFIAIYNDQGMKSRLWARVKKAYTRSSILRAVIRVTIGNILLIRGVLGRVLLPHRETRGMELRCDIRDWLGGWPFEVARPDEVTTFCSVRGFRIVHIRTVGRRLGCNQFVFRKHIATPKGPMPPGSE